MTDDYDTPQQREIDRRRDYRERVMNPSQRAQERYPIDEYPCRRCETQALPHLADNGSEFFWEHQHPEIGASGRSFCPRFGGDEHFGKPRPGTATSLWMTEKKTCRHRACTEEEYLETFQAVQDGADGYGIRKGW